MNDSPVAPQTVDQLREVIAAEHQVIPVGNQTKRPLADVAGATPVSLRNITGITQYEPSEFTFTALAGTPVREIVAGLQAKQQYLPFDPVLIEAGATIGGTVASGISGPGRFRYGGIRDFLLGVDFISGDGKLIRSGGKVVKNAAGFDIPKFLVGSRGRFGVMTELTFKVFPKPPATQTLGLPCRSHAEAIEQIACAARSTWELDAIDYCAEDHHVYLRVRGPQDSIEPIVNQICNRFPHAETTAGEGDPPWDSIQNLSWGANQNIVAKIPVTPAEIIPLSEQLAGKLWFSAAGNLLWLSMHDDEEVSRAAHVLQQRGLKGLVIQGDSNHSHQIGCWRTSEIETDLKTAFDPPGKFPSPT